MNPTADASTTTATTADAEPAADGPAAPSPPTRAADFTRFHAYEFGGPLGAAFIILFSHVSVYYLWIVVTYYHGAAVLPHSLAEVRPFFETMWGHVRSGARLTVPAMAWYLGFVGLQALFAYVLPGPWSKGLPIASLGGRWLMYKCNGWAAWWATLGIVAVLHVTRVLPITFVIDHLGSLLTAGMICGNTLALYVYLEARIRKNENRASGNVFYDFFMGINLNPRIGILDIKMFAEIRISWILLFLVTLSAAVKQYEVTGTLTATSAFMVLAHFLYANACQKGEECIPQTWDFFYENYGWYLSFWNCAGVAFTYSFQSVYLYQNGPVVHPWPYTAGVYLLLLASYWVWDSSNSQKARFRMQMSGTYIPRKTFPQMPWSTLKNPKYMTTASGSTLLIDGWYKYAQKIQYTADIGMALSWGMICGFRHVLPYYYVCFFVIMITHRYFRDKHKMERKYGDDYRAYREAVPYIFIPGLF